MLFIPLFFSFPKCWKRAFKDEGEYLTIDFCNNL